MYNKSHAMYLLSNNTKDKMIVGHAALENIGLIYGNNFLTVYTPFPELDNLEIGNVRLEYNHYSDMSFTIIADKDLRLYCPNREKSIIDTIAFIDKNYNEGELIEALQNYLNETPNLDKLYEVADYYGVERGTVDYWVNEAREESDMSMG